MELEAQGIDSKKEELKKKQERRTEQMHEHNKAYYEQHHEALLERNRKYKEDNKDKIAEQRKEYMKQKYKCDCGCEIVKNNLSTHKKTIKHLKFMDWIAKGLDPKEELAREEREESQRRMEDYFNGGRERQWLGMVDFMANLPSNKEWCEAFLKKREHLPEYHKFKDKIKAIRDKMESPPYPPISDEELKARKEKMKANS